MTKIIKSRTEVEDKIKNALRLITEPVVQTLSPKGRNVIYQDEQGGINQTNDGVTIARQIDSDDPVEQSIIDIVRQAALSTNRDAGDGTTTTTLLTNTLVQDGLKLIADGKNPMVLSKDLIDFGQKLLSRLQPIMVENDEQIENVARISANNDENIAKDVVDVVKTAGQDGMVFIESHAKPDTEIVKDTGFIVDGGLISPEYAQNQGNTAIFEECAVLVCDKRLYYEEEAETILRTAIEGGITKLVIVARDFIGKSVNVFSANQIRNDAINLILVKDPNAKENESESMTDLAVYLGGNVITERTGKLVDNLTLEDFIPASKVHATPERTVITTALKENEQLDQRVESLRKLKEDDDEDENVKRRLAALTNGIVTVKVGGATPIEVRERLFRYEDSINATRSAMKYGYLPGGGISLLGAFDPSEHPEEYHSMFRRYCEAPVRQIARNCGKHEDTIVSECKPETFHGYNAKKDEFGGMLEAGIMDPYKVLELAIKNSISVTNVILTTEWYIAIDKEKEND